MAGILLLRGMLVGLVAGLLCFCFLTIVGEPPVSRAIAIESQIQAANHAAAHALAGNAATAHAHPDEELFSRQVQSGIGLLTGVVIYNAAFGGLFALAFALAYGRIGNMGPQPTAALLAVLGFVAVTLVPGLKYPANPPSVGEADTIGIRTGLYFGMIAFSLAAMVLGMLLRQRLIPKFGAWNASLIAGGVYLAAMAAVFALAPSINEVPEHFPASLLWDFRTASLGAQILMWASIGLLFGFLTERAESAGSRKTRLSAPKNA